MSRKYLDLRILSVVFKIIMAAGIIAVGVAIVNVARSSIGQAVASNFFRAVTHPDLWAAICTPTWLPLLIALIGYTLSRLIDLFLHAARPRPKTPTSSTD